MLNHLAQRHDHGVTRGNLLRACMKLPCTIFIVVRNMQDGLTKPYDLCGREDCNILRVCERPLIFCALAFHKWTKSANEKS